MPDTSLSIRNAPLAFDAHAISSAQLTPPPRPPASHPQRFVISPKCKTFAPGNLRATADNPAYKALVSYWVDQQYTLRYR